MICSEEEGGEGGVLVVLQSWVGGGIGA